MGGPDCLAQGTLGPEVGDECFKFWMSHRQRLKVTIIMPDGLPERMDMQVVEPLR